MDRSRGEGSFLSIDRTDSIPFFDIDGDVFFPVLLSVPFPEYFLQLSNSTISHACHSTHTQSNHFFYPLNFLSRPLTHSSILQFCASMYSPAQSAQILALARDIVPGVRTLALPQGLQVERGPDAVVEFLVERIPGCVEEA